MAEYDDMASFAKMFSNSNAGGKMTKKKSAAARQKAKAKGLKNAAYVALGKPAGKKTKNSGGKSSAGKGSGSKGSGSSSSSSKSKPMTNTGSVYATTAASKGKSISDAKAASLRGSAAIALGSPMRRQPTTKDYQRAYNQVAGMALGNPMTKQVRAKPASSKPASSKPATAPKSTTTTTTPKKPTTSTTTPKKPTTSTTTPKFRPNVKPLKPVK